jgi:hypothetical protein
MRALDVTATLATFERRGPGTDAERRAAGRLARDLAAQGYKVTTEVFWGRPNWALAHAWHVALALAGSLVSVSHPTLGAALITVALVSVVADGLAGVSPGRRLTPERASQNVVARPPAGTDNGDHPPTRLIVTAKYDTPRAALIQRPALRRTAATLRRLTGPLALGWLAWLSILIAWSLAVAVIRATGHHASTTLGLIQLPPTVLLVLALALLLEAGAAAYGPATGDHGASAAVAIALTNAIKANPLRNLTVELVLQGAGEGHEIGMRRYVKGHRHELTQEGAIVLGISASGGGPPVWWQSDGRLIPIRYTRRLRQLAEIAADGLTGPHTSRGGPHTSRGGPYVSRGSTPALPARAHGLPAITIGTIESAAERTDTGALREFALRLLHSVDAELDPEKAAAEQTPTPA